MSGRSFLAGFVVALVVVGAGAAIVVAVFNPKVEKKVYVSPAAAAHATPRRTATADELTKAEEGELSKADTAMLIYCTEDRSFKQQFAYSRGVEYLVGLAREKPEAIYAAAGEYSNAPAPTMKQYLVDEIDVIRRKCGEPRELGSDRLWETDVEHLQEVAAELSS